MRDLHGLGNGELCGGDHFWWFGLCFDNSLRVWVKEGGGGRRIVWYDVV